MTRKYLILTEVEFKVPPVDEEHATSLFKECLETPLNLVTGVGATYTISKIEPVEERKLAVEEYPFPVYSTQHGGLVHRVDNDYVFVSEPSAQTGLQIGESMPRYWDITPANDLARKEKSETP